MASSSSRKKEGAYSTPSKGESSSGSVQGESQGAMERPAFPLQDPWNLEGFRDAKGLRHLVRRWCHSLHTFFFSVGELTITFEDVVNNFLLPVFGDENPFNISLSNKDLEVEDKLFSHFGGRTTSPGGKPARMGKWVLNFSREKDKVVRRARFLVLWLSLCGSSTDSYPITYRWANLKGGSLNLVKLFDQVGHLNWRSPREFSPKFACDFVLAFFLNTPRNTFDLRRGDEASLACFACISPSWLPMPSFSCPRYTHYSAHRVLWQFSCDQDIPPMFKNIVPSLLSLDLFLRLQAFPYWSWRSF
ncbi:hypothetical protein SO802_017393 [Lithocarpus litseifolius]|uniref:Aminotransferase-like plant mobile domain-containing protein n=1 Tax=Lithocarpus litseifolius TaxID=425828 RepID=A0AAW2CHW3_9ROSI